MPSRSDTTLVQLHAVPGDLVLPPHHGAPESLLDIRHEAQDELLRDQALHQPFGIGKVLLPTARPTIRLRLGKVERPRQSRRAFTRAPLGSPVLFQGFPHRPPVLRGRLHDDFLDVVLDEPVGYATQIGRRRADLLTLEVETAVDLDVGTTTASIFLWTSIPAIRYGIGLSLGERRACLVTSVRVAGYRRGDGAPRRPMIRSITHAPDQTVARPQWLHWLDSISPLSPPLLCRCDFHRVSRAAGPA
jgi:hypothetical protein